MTGVNNKNTTTYAYTDADITKVVRARNQRDGINYFQVIYTGQEALDAGFTVNQTNDDRTETSAITVHNGRTIIDLDAISNPEISPISGGISTQLIHLKKLQEGGLAPYPVTIVAPYKLADSWHWNALEITLESQGVGSCKRYNTDGFSYPVEDSVVQDIKTILPNIVNQSNEEQKYSAGIQKGVNCGLGAARILHDLKTKEPPGEGNVRTQYDDLDIDNRSDQQLRDFDSELVKNQLGPEELNRFCAHDRNANENSISQDSSEEDQVLGSAIAMYLSIAKTLSSDECESFKKELASVIESESGKKEFMSTVESIDRLNAVEDKSPHSRTVSSRTRGNYHVPPLNSKENEQLAELSKVRTERGAATKIQSTFRGYNLRRKMASDSDLVPDLALDPAVTAEKQKRKDDFDTLEGLVRDHFSSDKDRNRKDELIEAIGQKRIDQDLAWAEEKVREMQPIVRGRKNYEVLMAKARAIQESHDQNVGIQSINIARVYSQQHSSSSPSLSEKPTILPWKEEAIDSILNSLQGRQGDIKAFNALVEKKGKYLHHEKEVFSANILGKEFVPIDYKAESHVASSGSAGEAGSNILFESEWKMPAEHKLRTGNTFFDFAKQLAHPITRGILTDTNSKYDPRLRDIIQHQEKLLTNQGMHPDLVGSAEQRLIDISSLQGEDGMTEAEREALKKSLAQSKQQWDEDNQKELEAFEKTLNDFNKKLYSDIKEDNEIDDQENKWRLMQMLLIASPFVPIPIAGMAIKAFMPLLEGDIRGFVVGIFDVVGLGGVVEPIIDVLFGAIFDVAGFPLETVSPVTSEFANAASGSHLTDLALAAAAGVAFTEGAINSHKRSQAVTKGSKEKINDIQQEFFDKREQKINEDIEELAKKEFEVRLKAFIERPQMEPELEPEIKIKESLKSKEELQREFLEQEARNLDIKIAEKDMESVKRSIVNAYKQNYSSNLEARTSNNSSKVSSSSELTVPPKPTVSPKPLAAKNMQGRFLSTAMAA